MALSLFLLSAFYRFSKLIIKEVKRLEVVCEWRADSEEN